jgi:hypothetical protein
MKRLTLATIAFFALGVIGAPQLVAAQGKGKQHAKSLSLPVVGTGAGTFTGAFELQRFVTSNGQVMAAGFLTGTVTDATGTVLGTIGRTVQIPVTVGQAPLGVAQVAQATCDILHLDLGPLSLDLLGLQIDLSRIVLDITAESGAGNLLGNLLCAVTNLLNDPSGLANLLNQILDLLG